MIPIGDDLHTYHRPVGVYLLIGANVLVFMFELLLTPAQVRAHVLQWGLIPSALNQWRMAPEVWGTLITSLFMHGGWAHIISNMLYLGIFGANVEDNMGTRRFIAFYLLCGIIAGLAQVLAAPHSTIPIIGASGAVAGVLGAYLLLYPTARVYMLLPLFFVFAKIPVPAVLVLGFWFVSQLLNGVASLGPAMQVGGIAWWAHIGGFVAGIVLLLFFKRRRQPPPHIFYTPPSTDFYDEDEPWVH